MADNSMPSGVNGGGVEQEQTQPTYFQTQRALLVSDIAQSLDSVLTNLNRLNRSLEAVIAVGNEFSSVEGLWSTFEGVMADRSADESENAARNASRNDETNETSSDA